jgi:hypothetical protein
VLAAQKYGEVSKRDRGLVRAYVVSLTERGKRQREYKDADCRTPFEKLQWLPGAERFLSLRHNRGANTLVCRNETRCLLAQKL